jgi:hypothetical protein
MQVQWKKNCTKLQIKMFQVMMPHSYRNANFLNWGVFYETLSRTLYNLGHLSL